MRVYVPALDEDCPAMLALAMEGVEAHWIRCAASEFLYGKAFAGMWNMGDPFVVVEHDIVPWPGAIQSLIDCDCKWGTFAYPLNRGHLATSFGIGKYLPDGPAPEEWSQTPWDRLDGQVIPHLRKLYGNAHVHTPPVAHVRREVI